jgi:hypothetical protein
MEEKDKSNVVPLHPIPDTSMLEPSDVRRLTTEEMLRFENLNLRGLNLAMREERLTQESSTLVQEKHRLKQEVLQLRAILANKHGIAPENLMVHPDGTIEEKK